MISMIIIGYRNGNHVKLEEFIATIAAITEGQEWIINGNYSKANQVILARADTIIWLDYSFFRCLYQAFLRAIRRVIRKESCCGSNYEGLIRLFLSKNSILVWIMRTFRRRKITYNKLFTHNKENKTYIRLINPKETNHWLTILKAKVTY